MLDRVGGISVIETSGSVGLSSTQSRPARRPRRATHCYSSTTTASSRLNRSAHPSRSLHTDSASSGRSGSCFRTARLQEAGSIVWSDGWCSGSGTRRRPRSAGALLPRARSTSGQGAFLMLPVEAWRRLGRFDEIFAPGYYEDADLCLRAWAAGFEVWYEPRDRRALRALVVSTDRRGGELMTRNHDHFVARHSAALNAQPPRGVSRRYATHTPPRSQGTHDRRRDSRPDTRRWLPTLTSNGESDRGKRGLRRHLLPVAGLDRVTWGVRRGSWDRLSRSFWRGSAALVFETSSRAAGGPIRRSRSWSRPHNYQALLRGVRQPT